MSGKFINAYLEWVYRELKLREGGLREMPGYDESITGRELKSNLDKIEKRFIEADTTDWNQAMNGRGVSVDSLLSRVRSISDKQRKAAKDTLKQIDRKFGKNLQVISKLSKSIREVEKKPMGWRRSAKS